MMATETRPMIAGNWKMHGCRAALDEIRAIDRAAAQHCQADVVVCPPFPLLSQAAQDVSHVSIGAQDCHVAEKGAYTGGVSAGMISDAGARWVIVGHSECRQSLEQDDSQVASKVRAAQCAGLNVILCVGEPDGLDPQTASAFVIGQLIASLPREVDLSKLAIAYEPIWAIGTGRVPTAAQIEDSIFILAEVLRHRFGSAGADVRLLYGGSVNRENASDILCRPGIGGLLVGGASLSAESFVPIISATSQSKVACGDRGTAR